MEVAMALVDRGADIHASIDTPIHCMYPHHIELAIALVDRGADVYARNVIKGHLLII